MGEAGGTLAHAHKLFLSIAPIIKTIPADYSTNYAKKTENAGTMVTKSNELCRDVFFEKVPDFKDITMPDSKNFVKFDESAKTDLEIVPIMSETLRHIIPPEVRSMQGEIKLQI